MEYVEIPWNKYFPDQPCYKVIFFEDGTYSCESYFWPSDEKRFWKIDEDGSLVYRKNFISDWLLFIDMDKVNCIKMAKVVSEAFAEKELLSKGG